MKQILPLLILLFSCVFSSIAQDDIYFKPEPTKKSKSVIIVTKMNKSDNFKFCIEKLNDLNIFNQANEAGGSIKTDLLNTEKKGYPYYLTFFCKDSAIVISGKFKTGISIEVYGVKAEDNFVNIENKGMKGSPYQIVFTEMKSTAEKFGYPILLN